MEGSCHVDLKDVITTVELDLRPSRPPDYNRENHTLTALMDAMAAQLGTDGRGAAKGSTTVLQKLVETALELCGAHSAGVSTLEHENGSEIFRWCAAAGQWAVHRDEVMSRDSPSGTVVNRNEAMLMTYPGRHYTSVRNIALPIAEALLIPLHLAREPVGDLHHFTRRDTPIRRRGPSTPNEPRSLRRDSVSPAQ